MNEARMYEIAKRFANVGDLVVVKGSINTDHICVCVGDARAEFSAREVFDIGDDNLFEALLGTKLGREPLPTVGS